MALNRKKLTLRQVSICADSDAIIEFTASRIEAGEYAQWKLTVSGTLKGKGPASIELSLDTLNPAEIDRLPGSSHRLKWSRRFFHLHLANIWILVNPQEDGLWEAESVNPVMTLQSSLRVDISRRIHSWPDCRERMARQHGTALLRRHLISAQPSPFGHTASAGRLG